MTSRFLNLFACCSCLLAGCYGITHNPSQVPHLPFGDIVRTHGKPPGFAYFSNFDRRACKLAIAPLEITAPVQTQQVILATVTGDEGQPRRRRRVEWMLEGAGQIVEVDESGFFPGRGYKVDNNYAVSYTDYFEHCFDRGNDNPDDDFTVRPGQSWSVVSSAVEGDTRVTVYAPGIYSWDLNRVVATIHWVDAQWSLPPGAVARSGAPHVLTTTIFRNTDRRPLANYRVRYSIIDGPPVVFTPSRGAEEIAVSDLNGHAHATLMQATPQPGITRIAVEIIRAPDPTAPSSAGIVIARGETRVEWQAPQLGLSMTAPPAAALGQEVPCTLTVANTGSVDSQEITLRSQVPDGLQFVRSDPPATLSGNQLIWTLPPLAGGKSHAVQAVFRGVRPGPANYMILVSSRDGLRDQRQAVTEITVPRLDLQVAGPDTAMQDVPIEYRVTVTNAGTGPVTNVVLMDTFDPGLEHDSRANPVKKSIGNLEPGQSRTEVLRLTPRQVGRLVNRVSAAADGDLTAGKEIAVVVRRGQLKVELNGPARTFVNKQTTWNIVVGNSGELPLQNVTVKSLLPPELAFAGASQGGTPTANGEVTWVLPLLQPNERQTLQLTTNALRVAPQTFHIVTASAPPSLLDRTQTSLEIQGLPAFQLDVRDTTDPVEVGGGTSYVIDVINRGSLAGANVEIVAIVPPQLKVTNTRGPVSAPRQEGNRLIFPVLDTLPVGQKINYTVEVQAVQPGDARFRVELKCASLQESVAKEESTMVSGGGRVQGPTRGEPPIARGAED